MTQIVETYLTEIQDSSSQYTFLGELYLEEFDEVLTESLFDIPLAKIKSTLAKFQGSAGDPKAMKKNIQMAQKTLPKMDLKGLKDKVYKFAVGNGIAKNNKDVDSTMRTVEKILGAFFVGSQMMTWFPLTLGIMAAAVVVAATKGKDFNAAAKEIADEIIKGFEKNQGEFAGASNAIQATGWYFVWGLFITIITLGLGGIIGIPMLIISGFYVIYSVILSYAAVIKVAAREV